MPKAKPKSSFKKQQNRLKNLSLVDFAKLLGYEVQPWQETVLKCIENKLKWEGKK